MRAGELNTRVTFQRKNPAQDSFGAEKRDPWLDVCTVWGAVEPLLGRESLEGRSLEAVLTTRIRIRYRADIDATMRAVEGSHTYEIKAPPQHVRNERRELVLLCQEVS